MELRTIGDHVRKKRLDLGLTQLEAARQIGVDKTTVFNWEVGRTTPNLRANPGVVQFLGYSTLTTGETLGERLKSARVTAGLSQDELAQRLQVDPTTIWKWEHGRTTPPAKFWPRIEDVIGRDPVIPDLPLADRIRAGRRSLGLTQKEMGGRLGVPPQLVSEWERGLAELDKQRMMAFERILQKWDPDRS